MRTGVFLCLHITFSHFNRITKLINSRKNSRLTTLTRAITGQAIRKASTSLSTKNTDPSTKATRPPNPKIPKLGSMASASSKIIPKSNKPPPA
uniref:hypothetical protein n=1 Tax=Shewanella chilikensis TaxID=558541 RepID=UPI00384D183F